MSFSVKRLDFFKKPSSSISSDSLNNLISVINTSGSTLFSTTFSGDINVIPFVAVPKSKSPDCVFA